MGEVISFAVFKHRLRVDTALEAAAARESEQLSARRAELHKEYGNAGRSGVLFADIVADVIEAKEQEEKAAEPYRYVPAYCDPENERRGAKYDGTRNLSTTEIAKRMREDIKAAKVRGDLPKALKCRVRSKYFSGGSSIDIDVTELPEGLAVWSPDFLRHEHEHERGAWVPYRGNDRHSPEFRAVLNTLESIHRAYNRDNSDPMTDYFDVRYYGDVGIYWEISRGIRERELAAALASAEG